MSAAVMTACTPGRASAARRVDRADAAVRDRAAQDHGMQRVRARHIVDELAAAAQEAQVLQALDRAADQPVAGAGLGHGCAARPRAPRPAPGAASRRQTSGAVDAAPSALPDETHAADLVAADPACVRGRIDPGRERLAVEAVVAGIRHELARLARGEHDRDRRTAPPSCGRRLGTPRGPSPSVRRAAAAAPPIVLALGAHQSPRPDDSRIDCHFVFLQAVISRHARPCAGHPRLDISEQ